LSASGAAAPAEGRRLAEWRSAGGPSCSREPFDDADADVDDEDAAAAADDEDADMDESASASRRGTSRSLLPVAGGAGCL